MTDVRSKLTSVFYWVVSRVRFFPERRVPLTRIANRIAKGNSGQSDLSPRGEEIAAALYLFSPRGEGGREAAG
ncbi:hypothetical protein [Mesorhizobium sp. LjRoot246]|uniref:hypothetical protein n=1 Tax=Mesorhizobium sp. LjRoot246 TaxID=3342294 RepID=UPI003ECC60F2